MMGSVMMVGPGKFIGDQVEDIYLTPAVHPTAGVRNRKTGIHSGILKVIRTKLL